MNKQDQIEQDQLQREVEREAQLAYVHLNAHGLLALTISRLAVRVGTSLVAFGVAAYLFVRFVESVDLRFLLAGGVALAAFAVLVVSQPKEEQQ